MMQPRARAQAVWQTKSVLLNPFHFTCHHIRRQDTGVSRDGEALWYHRPGARFSITVRNLGDKSAE